MTIWLVAVVGGVFLALLSYRWRGASAAKTLFVALLRALAFTLLIALLLDAVAGLPRPVAPIVALDVSQSWVRGGDSASWVDASWVDASWLDASWNDASWEDNAEGDASVSSTFTLDPTDQAELQADPTLAVPPAALPPATASLP